jgi:hypothetical protein
VNPCFSLEPKEVNITAHNNLLSAFFRILLHFWCLIFVHFVATWLVLENFYKGHIFFGVGCYLLKGVELLFCHSGKFPAVRII